MPAFLIGIGGGSASGKTTLARHLAACLRSKVAIIAMDQYYRDGASLSVKERATRNYDTPDAIEWPLLTEHLDALELGREICAPLYDFGRHARRPETAAVSPEDVLVVEGLHALSLPMLRDRLDWKVFVDTPLDLCFIRRLQRDTVDRGRSVESVVEQYLAHVRPMYEAHVLPARAHADLVVSGETVVASARLVAASVEGRFRGGPETWRGNTDPKNRGIE